jgi:HEAT repeat protein
MPVGLALLGLLLGLGSGSFAWPGAQDVEARDRATSDGGQRLSAVLLLTTADPAVARRALASALRDRDAGIRLLAARLLVRRGAPEALETAVAWLASREPRDRVMGLQILRDTPTLSPEARMATERALGDGDTPARLLALEVLSVHPGASSFGAVLRALEDDQRDIRLRAARLLAGTREPRAALALLARLADADGQVRAGALAALGTLGDPNVAPALLRLLTESTPDLRLGAIDALARMRAAAAVPALIPLARRLPRDELARRAQLALGEIGTPEAINALVALAREPPATEDLLAALRLAGARALPQLIRELTNGSATSAALAADVLGRIGDHQATLPLVSVVERQRGAVTASLDALAALADPAAVPALVHAATDAPTADVRALALIALEKTGDDRGLVALSRALGDADPQVRARAVKLAARLSARPNAGEIAARINDPDRQVRQEVAVALARLAAPSVDVARAIAGALSASSALPRDPSELRALGDALEAAVSAQDDPAQAQTLARAFLAAPPRCSDALARGLAVAAARAPLSDGGLIDRLIGALDGGGEAALGAAEALGSVRLDAEKEAALVRSYAGAEDVVKARLAPALVHVRSGATLLIAEIEAPGISDQVRAAAAWAAAALPEAAPALRRAIAGPSPAVAANAGAALARIAAPARPGAGLRRTSSAAARLLAADASPCAPRWVAFVDAEGTRVWTMTDATGRARVTGLGEAPVTLRLEEPDADQTGRAPARPAD